SPSNEKLLRLAKKSPPPPRYFEGGEEMPFDPVTVVSVRATASGRIVSWAALKQGELVDTSRLALFFLTTTLTDVITDLCALAESLDEDYRIATVVPNGFTTAAL